MARHLPVLLRIDNNEKITQENNYEFLHHLQQALLLALHERGRMGAMAYHHAVENLEHQRRERARKLQREGERP